MRDDVQCPACGAPGAEVFHHEPSVPANSCLLLADPQEARDFPRGELLLAFCRRCGFITNTRFDPALAEYSSRYEETQGFSERFMRFARDLAKRWVDRYDLHGKSVLEIGCGKGEFLELMVEAGVGHGTGIDPGVNPDRTREDLGDRLTWIADFYSQDYAHPQADAVVCRHTLEHISDVRGFLQMIRAAIGDRTETVVLFELPDVLRVLREVAFWDVYYEHCSYFSAGSLARLFRACGFEVLDVSLDYDDQYLLLEARPSTTPGAGEPLPVEADLEALAKGTQLFEERFARTLAGWRERLGTLREAGGTAVIWGSGSKGVSFLTNLAMDDAVACAVDINPYRQGKAMIGTGHRIVGPDDLVEIRPDLVVAMNPIYLGEIRDDLARRGLSPELVAV